MIKLRNTSYAPILDREGKFVKPLLAPPKPKTEGIWYTGLKPYERLFYHQTMNSVRKCRRYAPNPNIPRDFLDFRLQSRFDPTCEPFADRVDTVMQRETTGVQTFRILRNTKDVAIKQPLPMGHPLRISGLTVKISPHSIKLINSSHRTQLTNHGYSRQPADGNFFRY